MFHVSLRDQTLVLKYLRNGIDTVKMNVTHYDLGLSHRVFDHLKLGIRRNGQHHTQIRRLD